MKFLVYIRFFDGSFFIWWRLLYGINLVAVAPSRRQNASQVL
jgi:hypothetical protein